MERVRAGYAQLMELKSNSGDAITNEQILDALVTYDFDTDVRFFLQNFLIC
jgi:hypothetical protein